VPGLEYFAPLGASLRHARGHARAARLAVENEVELPSGHIDVALSVFDEWLSAVLFPLQWAFYRCRDQAAGLRDRLFEASRLPSSTLLTYGAVGIMAGILANDLINRSPAAAPAPLPEQRPEWIEIVRPHGAFALNSPSLEGLDAQYVVRRHRLGGGRKDELTFGDPSALRPYVRVVLYRPGSEGMAEPDPLAAVVSVASQSAIDAELQETNRRLRTKFGTLPVVAMTVKNGADTRRCIATASAWSDPRLGLVAWWCNNGPELVPHGEFACLLDRLALMSAGGDDRLAEFFAQAELKRGSCGSYGSFVSPTPKRPDDWIHAKARPPLRGRIAGR
jgi:hypothetical protein